MQAELSRRSFLRASALAGGGLLVDFSVPVHAAQGAAVLTAFVAIDTSGAITIAARNPEMGQGIKTSLPMIVAEELDADWAQVRVEQADLDPARYGPQFSGASMSTMMGYLPMRQAGAAARDMLVRVAAARWGVAVAEISTAASVAHHKASGRSLPYAALAQEAAGLAPAKPGDLRLKSPEQFTIIGSRRGGVDTPKIVRGDPLYSIDTRLPGMLHAVFVGPPSPGAVLRRVDDAAARAMPGVKAVIPIQGVKAKGTFAGSVDSLTDGVAIVATNWWYAQQARDKLVLEWDESAAQGHGDAAYAARAKALLDAGGGKVAFKAGDAKAALGKAAKVISARYDYPFVAHNTLEPQNCTALFKDGKLTFWAPAQQPENGRKLVAQCVGVAEGDITVHVTRIGGGFGRRLMSDFMAQAGAIAKAMPGVPINVLYNRTDDITHDFYRPAGWHKFKAGIDQSGRLTAFTNHFVSFGPGEDPQFFANMAPFHMPEGLIPDIEMTHSVFPTIMPLGAMRAPTSNAHAFVFQGFLDEVARAGGRSLPALMLDLFTADKQFGETDKAGETPRSFNTARARAVVQKAMAMSDWGNVPRKPGIGRGFAFYFCHRGYFAEVVEVAVKGKAVTVRKVWAAGDVGRQIVNPLGAEAQVRGSILDGLSQALNGQKITIENGRVQQSNFHDHPFARIDRLPPVEVAFVPSDAQPGGLGEPALPPVIPALANAIFDATGKRLRSMPFAL
ncbi:xanthine dehydrogenase family protein molybdopterin-binding subunit [Novosphingobium sediminicola]|uniref:Isoquinoline 1-oxidoreductase beta subunit n=1 Tax=Novosphingobium sediminicola TaxID=563162 RepID=A0A7W6G5H2_9SPHN|nr:molybdopterin cofactor-binding domain-containing protein [Novosphingobium sediminicola]MBB3954253.1 isoquinoline 1-oxidoreductase beta subunit [Novosphingobium sediminicola]